MFAAGAGLPGKLFFILYDFCEVGRFQGSTQLIPCRCHTL